MIYSLSQSFGQKIIQFVYSVSFASIGPSIWNRVSSYLRSTILSAPLRVFLSRPKSYFFLELKCTESASVWLTP